MLPKLWESNKYQLGTTDNGITFASIAFTNKVCLGPYKLICFCRTSFISFLQCLLLPEIWVHCIGYDITWKRNKLQKLKRANILWLMVCWL